jgi:hypothetical protein
MDEFSKLKTKIEKAEKISDVLDDVADGFTLIAANYRKVANLSINIDDYYAKSMDALLPGEAATEKTIITNNARIESLQFELSKAQKVIDSETSDANSKQRSSATVSANKSQINSLQTQNRIWEKFNERQTSLSQALEDRSERIDTILFILGKNADVYEEAARTVRMTKNAAKLIGDLSSLQDIDSSLTALQESWSEVDDIVDAIGEIDFGMF